MGKQRLKQQNYPRKLLWTRTTLLIELFFTVCIAIIIALSTYANLSLQAAQFAADTELDYANLVEKYTRNFSSVMLLIEDKIKENPSFDEMQNWLMANDERFARALGENVYDGIALTYRGGYAHSWDYGDYTHYDPNTRPWYNQAREADGKVTIVAPYVTYLDASYINSDEYIILTVAQKYNDEISVDYDVKISEIHEMLTARKASYPQSHLILFDKDGYILSCNSGDFFAHNINTPDNIIGKSLSSTVITAAKTPDVLNLNVIDGAPVFIYTVADNYGNTFCEIIPLLQVIQKDLLVPIVIIVAMLAFEVYLFLWHRRTIKEFRGRDERLTAVTTAAYDERMYVDLETMKFYGNEKALKLYPDGDYNRIFEFLLPHINNESERVLFEDFISPNALLQNSGNMYTLEGQKFFIDWPLADGKTKPLTIQINRMISVIDGKKTAGLLCKDVSEDAEILKDALKQAESANRAKGDFMSRMSHEIRTPLNAVMGYINIAKDCGDDSAKMTRCLEKSSVAAKHLLSIINDVLDISSIESGRMKIADEDFDLSKLIESLSTIFYAQAKNKKVNFEVNLNLLSVEWVRGDSLRLNQILLNLLSNAIKFTPEQGDVTLSIKQMGIFDERVHIQFKVSDTGIGMSKEFSSRMFTPFEQENASTAKNYGGSGLGLSISFNLIKMMGGTIDVESVQDEGTTFTVSMSFGITEKKTAIMNSDSFSNLRILVVDDDEVAREYLKMLFERCGAKCDTVSSGKRAISRVRNRLTTEYPYNMCVVDWNMSEMNGIETCKQIREICGKDISLIMATGYDISEATDDAKVVGVDKILTKPVFQSTIFDLMVNTFGRYKPTKKEAELSVDFTGMKIIIAEDNEMNMEIACEIISKSGIEITKAYTGKQAFEYFINSENKTYDAVLMDIQMPIMNGYEATKAIRASSHPQAQTIPIIAMTANAFTSDITMALSVDMNDHISKPISYDRLFDVLGKLTGKKEN